MNQLVKTMRGLQATTGQSAVNDFTPRHAEASRRRTDVSIRGRLRSGGKAIVDPIAAIILLIALAPLMSVRTLMVWRQSRRPIFYGQRRWGADGQTFMCWKFRTMAIDADERLEEVLSGSTDARKDWDQFVKLANDPRGLR
jgi:lipopolysaccharide/colanic/teichoic acid biosynthesis glycosyltransferase